MQENKILAGQCRTDSAVKKELSPCIKSGEYSETRTG